MNSSKCSTIGFVLAASMFAALTGCVGPVDESRHARGYDGPPPGYVVVSGPVVQDNYVYYPDYQVYYRGSTRQYVYQEGSRWVTRPAPARVSAEVLVASPSVRLDFHDSPSIHHASVAQTYPKHWSPQGGSHGNKDGEKKDKNEGH